MAMLCTVWAEIFSRLILWGIWHTGLTVSLASSTTITAQGYICGLTAEAPGTTA